MGRPGKTERGIETRARIVVAATDLFLEHGYLSTTMAMIAQAADLSVQALYLAFGSKVAILKTVHDVDVVGDTDDVALLERPWLESVRAEPDGATALKLLIDHLSPIVAQTSAIYDVLQAAAADPEIADLLAVVRRQRFTSMHEAARALDGKPGLNQEVSAELAGDILYGILSIELYRLLVIECGWAVQDWISWVHASVALRVVSTT